MKKNIEILERTSRDEKMFDKVRFLRRDILSWVTPKTVTPTRFDVLEHCRESDK